MINGGQEGVVLCEHCSLSDKAERWCAVLQVVGLHEKLPRLMQILRSKPHGTRVIIFCSTKRMCDQLSGQLREFHASAIHGDKRQQVFILHPGSPAKHMKLQSTWPVDFDSGTCLETYALNFGSKHKSHLRFGNPNLGWT